MIKSKKVRLEGHIARREKINVYKILVGTPEGKRPRGRPNSRCEDNIGMDVRKIIWEGLQWMHLVQDRDQWRGVVNTVLNLRIP